MKITEISDPIASRTYELGKVNNVVVTVGNPKPFDDGDYYCPYSIDYGKGNLKYSYAGGVDSIQALCLCLKKIEFDLNYYAKSENTKFTWLDEVVESISFLT